MTVLAVVGVAAVVDVAGAETDMDSVADEGVRRKALCRLRKEKGGVR